MKNRISQIIEAENITKAAFAKRINVSAPFITQLCKGDANPSDRTTTDICREFHVRREWLESGEGPMKLPEPDESLDYINALMADCKSPFKDLIRAILIAYDRASPEAQKAINAYIQQVKSELGK